VLSQLDEFSAKLKSIHGAIVLEKEGQLISVDLRASGEQWVEAIPTLTECRFVQTVILIVTPESLKRVNELEEMPSLKVLKFEKSNLAGGPRMKVASFPKIEEISLDRCTLSEATLQSIAASKSIKRIRLLGSNVSNAGLAYLKDMVQLELLDLNECEQISDVGVKHLQGLTRLRNLSLWGPQITDKGLAYLSKFTDLSALTIRKCDVTDRGFEVLSRMRKLKELDLAFTDAGDGALDSMASVNVISKLKLRASGVTPNGIASHIFKFANLTLLDLGETNMNDAAMTAIGKMTRLEDLNLLRTHVTDEMISMLVNLPLKRLNLDDNQGITDKAMDSISHFQTLEFLHLGKTQVTDQSIEKIALLSNLKDLILNDTVVSKESLQRLQQKLPNLTIKK